MAEVPDTVTDTSMSDDVTVGTAAGTVAREQPTLVRSISIGVVIAVSLAATTFFLIAIPFFTLASFESNGLDRAIVRTGLFRIALPVGGVVGIIGGAVGGRWLHVGGHWTVEDGGDRYSAR